jgi:pyrroloquinoline quinone biosynthesis protein B
LPPGQTRRILKPNKGVQASGHGKKRVFIRVLGAAAGGGYPQWNCNGAVSRAAWDGQPGALRRTQSSLALSADGVSFVLLNASPDIREQIGAHPALQPRADGPARNSPLAAVVLTNGDVDHVAGLLSLRERHRFSLHATLRVLDVLAANPIFRVLDPACVSRHPLPLGAPVTIAGLKIEAFSVPGKIALYLEDARAPGFGTQEGDTIGLKITSPGGKTLFYIPGCAQITDALRTRLSGADVLFLDGTLFTDNEMIRAGLSDKTGARMGHVSMSGPEGAMAGLENTRIARRIFIHINGSNPALIDASPERRAVEAAGWDVAHDGMEFSL